MQGPRTSVGPTGALLGENTLGAPNTGIGLKRNLAEKLQHANAFDAAKHVPDGIGEERGNGYEEQGSPKAHVTCAGEGSGGEHQRKGRNRQAELFGKDPRQKHGVSVPDQEFERAVHGGGSGPCLVLLTVNPLYRGGRVCDGGQRREIPHFADSLGMTSGMWRIGRGDNVSFAQGG